MHPGVGQHERASFQSPAQTSSVQKDRVEREPTRVCRWSVGTVGLLLNLKLRQFCDGSNNVVRSLDDPESTREVAERGLVPPQRNSATATVPPPGPGRVHSPAPQAESG